MKKLTFFVLFLSLVIGLSGSGNALALNRDNMRLDNANAFISSQSNSEDLEAFIYDDYAYLLVNYGVSNWEFAVWLESVYVVDHTTNKIVYAEEPTITLEGEWQYYPTNLTEIIPRYIINSSESIVTFDAYFDIEVNYDTWVMSLGRFHIEGSGNRNGSMQAPTCVQTVYPNSTDAQNITEKTNPFRY